MPTASSAALLHTDLLLNWLWNALLCQCVTFGVGRTWATLSCATCNPNVAISYGQVLSRVQVDHQQGRGQAVVGQAPVCAHAPQHLGGRQWRSNRMELSFSVICDWRLPGGGGAVPAPASPGWRAKTATPASGGASPWTSPPGRTTVVRVEMKRFDFKRPLVGLVVSNSPRREFYLIDLLFFVQLSHIDHQAVKKKKKQEN